MDDKPDIIFIVLDTQRADRISCFNKTAPETPHFNSLAKEATLFTRAVSPAQWTLPAHASMFTGLYPSQHTAQQLNSVLPENIPTIAERLWEEGYSTHVFSNNPIIGLMDNGLTRGFKQVHNFIHVGFNVWSAKSNSEHKPSSPLIGLLRKIRSWLAVLLGVGEKPTDIWWVNSFRYLLEFGINAIGGSKYRNTRRTLDAAANLCNQPHKDGKPVFAFINLMGTHIPYDPPKWAIERVKKSASIRGTRRTIRWTLNYLQQNPANWLKMDYLAPDVQQTLLAYYDAEVIAQDRLLGRFISKLRKTGRLDTSCIIVVSDHGDHLGEKARVNHIFGAYDPLTRVPLLIRDSTQKLFKHGQVIDSFVSTCQLFHMILALARIITQDEDYKTSGISLLIDSIKTIDTAFVESLPPQAFVERLHSRYPQWIGDKDHTNTVYAVYHNNFKLIDQINKHPEMYAVGTTDPLEVINIANQEKERYTQLNALLTDFTKQMTPTSPAILRDNTDNQVLNRLRDLGYVD